MKVLKLTLKKAAFDVMVTREKRVEFRELSPWIKSRLYDKQGKLRHYDLVEFTNGYGATRPRFVCEFINAKVAITNDTVAYSNGLKVKIKANQTIYIVLGDIKSKTNF